MLGDENLEERNRSASNLSNTLSCKKPENRLSANMKKITSIVSVETITAFSQD